MLCLQMDNCLIDDRRIHVDFSQSVSKLWGQFRQSKRNGNKGIGPDRGFFFLHDIVLLLRIVDSLYE